MLYHLFTFLDSKFNLIGAGVFKYITFRAALAIITSLVISLFIGKKIINYLQSKQISDEKRDLGLKDMYDKSHVPTMGGVIIIAAILIPSLLFAKLTNVYVILVLISTVWLGTLGFLDDYIKVFKKNKNGLAGKYKIIGQVGLGIIIGTTLYVNKDVVMRKSVKEVAIEKQYNPDGFAGKSKWVYNEREKMYQLELKSTVTTIPFVKNNEFDYANLLRFMGDGFEKWAFLIYIPFIIFIITAVSNGANLTDGLDGLTAGLASVIIFTLAIFAYVSGNSIFSSFLNIMYIPGLEELTIFSAAMIGACIGFLWFNAFPAQVFMGDTGSLTLGGLIGILAIMVRKELLIPVLCGIFLLESVSVMMQVGYFKYTKKRYGEGKRIFLMAPIHHHYQKKGFPESKIVARFWIIGIILAVMTFITLKLR